MSFLLGGICFLVISVFLITIVSFIVALILLLLFGEPTAYDNIPAFWIITWIITFSIFCIIITMS